MEYPQKQRYLKNIFSLSFSKKFFSFIIICFLLITDITSIIAKDVKQDKYIPIKPGRIIYVDDDSPNGDGSREHPYRYIDDGIYVAQPGDTVYVFGGWYYENVFVNKSITLTGEDKTTVIVFPYYAGPDFLITADNVTVSDFTIADYQRFCPNIKMKITTNNCTITNNIFTDCMPFDCIAGVIFDDAHYNVFSENQFRPSGNILTIQTTVAIRLINGSTHNIIRKNTVSGYLGGILISSSNNNIVDYNGFYASSSIYESHNNIIQYNTFGPYFMVTRSHNNTISPKNLFTTMDFNGSSDNKIVDNNFVNYGLKLYYKLKRPQIIFQDSNDFFDHNYWGRPRLLPKIIFGYNGTERVIEVDWHPAKEPN